MARLVGGRPCYAFRRSHEALRPGMTLREAFGAGLADYLAAMQNKNVPGSAPAGALYADAGCKQRVVLDITYIEDFALRPGRFLVRVFCDGNTPSMNPQVVPQREFRRTEEFLQALDGVYAPWARSMTFHVESPPLRLWGVHDYYEFTTGAGARVEKVSPIHLARR